MESLLGADYEVGKGDEEEARTSTSAFSAYALSVLEKKEGQLILLPTRDQEFCPTPKNLLQTMAPAEAQEVAPLFGPLRPDQEKNGGLYRNFRNHAMGHILECDKDDAAELAATKEREMRTDFVGLKERSEMLAKRAREKADLENLLAKERGVVLPEMSHKRARNDDSTSENFLGPWAPFEGEMERREVLRVISQNFHGSSEEGTIIPTLAVEPETVKVETSSIDEPGTVAERVSTFIFHAKDSAVDYQGRSWLEGPVAASVQKPLEDGSYRLPTRCVHKFSGHTKGVNRIRWFPKTAHLLLSGSMDGNCKIWNVTVGARRCFATYSAHTKAVRDIAFTTTGEKFYSASFDTTIKLWDTEYGKVITSFGNDSIPFCVSVHPDPAQQNVVVCASYNKKAVQYDANTGQVVQEYNEHLAIVNTATFCEGGKRIVTTSDDKKMFVWEFGIGVVVKHIAEPYMHAMPAVQLTPNGKYLACQSMDNQIVVYEGSGRFRLQSRKRFRGHSCTGYAILPGFSPDGNFLTSGDSSGRCWFWDWKTSKMYRHVEAHDGVCMASIWHPYQSSLVATCGWDGLVKLWE